jgi:hypothetical protein
MQVYSAYYSADASYKNYFNVATTGRLDNTSTLPSGNASFFYPSVSISTNLVDYLHMSSSISYFKVRASYADVKGALTTAQAPSAYALVTGSSIGSLLGYGTELYTSYDGPTYTNQNQYTITTYGRNQPAVGYSNTIANPALKPFDVKSTEVGTDFRMFQNRIGIDATYFNTINGPQIYALSTPISTGYAAENVNGITTKKQGLEITFTAAPVKSRNGFNWDFAVNYSTFTEKLKSVYGGQNTLTLGNHTYGIGERLDDYYSTGFVRDNQGKIVNAGGGPLSSPGGIGNNIFLGHLNPDFTIGFSNHFSYKNFSFSFQFDGRIGGKIYDDVWYHAMNGGTAIESDQGAIAAGRLADWTAAKNNGGTLPSSYAGTFVAPGSVITAGTPIYANGQITNLKDITFAPNTTPTLIQNYLSSTLGSNFDEYYTISRTFVKLREVQFAYNFSKKALGKSIIKSASIALVGRNLLYFAKRKDFDIDQYASGFNAGDRSYTGTSGDVTLSSPTFRRYGLNINIGF